MIFVNYVSSQGVPINRGLRRRLLNRLRSKRSFVNVIILEKYSNYKLYRLTLLMCNWDTLYIIGLKLHYSLLMIKFPPVQLMLETTGLSGIQWSPKYRGTESLYKYFTIAMHNNVHFVRRTIFIELYM